MALPLPPHLQPASVSSGPVAFAWSQGDAMSALGSRNTAVENKLGDLSFRALLGLSASLGEWMHRRFVALHDDHELLLLTEAIWAASIDFRYLNSDALTFPRADDDPVRGPIQEAKRLLRRSSEIFVEVDYGLVRYVRGFSSVVNYVQPGNKSYQKWLKAVVARLATESAPSARDSAALDADQTQVEPLGCVDAIWGTPLPREAFDPAFDLAAHDRAALIDALLGQIAARPNPFLRTPAELLAAGFSGTPYRHPSN